MRRKYKIVPTTALPRYSKAMAEQLLIEHIVERSKLPQTASYSYSVNPKVVKLLRMRLAIEDIRRGLSFTQAAQTRELSYSTVRSNYLMVQYV